jgi:hypothetical protein
MTKRAVDDNAVVPSIESGMRLLVLLVEIFPAGLNLSKAFYLDFLMMHSGAYEGGPDSLHPRDPFASSTLTVRREAVRRGLSYFSHRGLISERFDIGGVEYIASETAGVFVDQLESIYFVRAKTVAQWVREQAAELTVQEMKLLVEAATDIWRAHFEPLSVVEDFEGGGSE